MVGLPGACASCKPLPSFNVGRGISSGVVSSHLWSCVGMRMCWFSFFVFHLGHAYKLERAFSTAYHLASSLDPCYCSLRVVGCWVLVLSLDLRHGPGQGPGIPTWHEPGWVWIKMRAERHVTPDECSAGFVLHQPGGWLIQLVEYLIPCQFSCSCIWASKWWTRHDTLFVSRDL